MFLQLNVPNVFLTELVKILPRSSNNEYDSPKALNYRIYKDNLVFENYLNILNDKDNLTISKFRTTNHKLPVENGRWKNIARENRICPICNNVIHTGIEI
jgi:hypothetical protein